MGKYGSYPIGSPVDGTEEILAKQHSATVRLTLAKVATTAAAADIGLGNVNNTSDANKPVSTAQAAADALVASNAAAATALKANIASPSFTGTVTVPNGAALGTPASLTLTNATGLPNAGLINSNVTFGSTAVALGASSTSIAGLTSLGLTSGSTINWNSDTFLGRGSAGNIKHGAADAASPVAQTISVQNVVAGTSNTAGTALTIAGSQGTGTGIGGSIQLQTARAGTTGSAQNALVNGLVLDGNTGQVGINTAPGASARLLIEDGTGNNQAGYRYSSSFGGFAIGQISNGNVNFGLADNAALIMYSNNGSGGYMRIQGGGGIGIGVSASDYGTSNLNVQGSISSGLGSVTKTGTSGTVGAAESSTIFNASGTFTATLPAAAGYPGRWWYCKSIANQSVISASSNVVPLAGGAAGTAILSATAGKWATLQSDGANWQIMAAN